MTTSRFEIGPGIECEVKDTEDRSGMEILLKGRFRHGGLTHDEIESRLSQCFGELDIDMNSTGIPQPEWKAALLRLLDYVESDEKADWEERGRPEDHIYPAIQKIRREIKRSAGRPNQRRKGGGK